MHGFFVEQMAMYSSYHRDRRNRLTHFFGVPSIVFAILIPMAWGGLFDVYGYTVSVATLFAAAVMLFYFLCDAALAVVMLVINFALLRAAETVAGLELSTGWTVFGLFFVGGWIIQLVGHAFEGRKPALVDNLFQIFIAPMFLAAEAAIALGFKKTLHEEVESRWPAYLPEAGKTA